MNDERIHDDRPRRPADETGERIAREPTVMPGRWVRRGVYLLAAIVVAFVAWKMSSAFFPRWWAQRVADQSQGDFSQSVWWGLFYGFVFTLVPLLVLFQVRRRFLSWIGRGVVALVAVALAAPNWLTLAVVVGNSKAAHAGERIFDTEAPGFRNATLGGAIAGAVVAVALSGGAMWLKHRKTQVKKLRGELDERKRVESERAKADSAE